MTLSSTERQLLTVRETAAKLQVSERTVWRLLKRRALPALHVGGQVRIDPDELEAYLYGDPKDAA